jgi:hypothetical protein
VSKLTFEITALDKVTAELGKINSQISGFSNKASSAFGGISKAVGLFSGAMSAVFAANKVAQIVNSGLEYGETIATISRKTGMATGEVQKWKYVTEKMGSSLDSLARPLRAMDTMIYEDSKSLKVLGIATRDSNGAFRDKSKVLEDVLIKLAGIPDPTERSAVATKLFGKGAGEMLAIVGEGPEKIRALIDETHNYGVILSDELITKLDEAKKKQELLQKQLEITKIKMVAVATPAIGHWLTGMNMLIDQWAKGFETMTDKSGIGAVIATKNLESMNAELTKQQELVKKYDSYAGMINGKKIWSPETYKLMEEARANVMALTSAIYQLNQEKNKPTGKTIPDIVPKTPKKDTTADWLKDNAITIGRAMDSESDKRATKQKKLIQDTAKIWDGDINRKWQQQKKFDEMMFDNQKDSASKEIQITQKKYDAMYGIADLTAEQMKQLEKRNADEIKAVKTQQTIDAAQMAISTLQSVVGQQHKYIVGYKALAMAEAGMNTYTAATKALNAALPPFNFILMGITIAAGLAQQAKIAAMSFASGGFAPPGSFIRTGEQGMEYMHMLPGGGARVFNSNTSNQIDRSDRSSRAMTVNIYDQSGNLSKQMQRSLLKGEMDRFLNQFMTRASRRL